MIVKTSSIEPDYKINLTTTDQTLSIEGVSPYLQARQTNGQFNPLGIVLEVDEYIPQGGARHWVAQGQELGTDNKLITTFVPFWYLLKHRYDFDGTIATQCESIEKVGDLHQIFKNLFNALIDELGIPSTFKLPNYNINIYPIKNKTLNVEFDPRQPLSQLYEILQKDYKQIIFSYNDTLNYQDWYLAETEAFDSFENLENYKKQSWNINEYCTHMKALGATDVNGEPLECNDISHIDVTDKIRIDKVEDFNDVWDESLLQTKQEQELARLSNHVGIISEYQIPLAEYISLCTTSKPQAVPKSLIEVDGDLCEIKSIEYNSGDINSSYVILSTANVTLTRALKEQQTQNKIKSERNYKRLHKDVTTAQAQADSAHDKAENAQTKADEAYLNAGIAQAKANNALDKANDLASDLSEHEKKNYTQRGYETLSTSTTKTITFDTHYKDTPNIQLTVHTGVPDKKFAGVLDATANSFKIRTRGSGSNFGVSWSAIGEIE